MLILLLALAAAALAAPPLLRVVGRPAFLILAAVLAAGFFWVLSLFVRGTFADGEALTESISWLDELHLRLDFRMDALSGVFSLIILGVGALILLYCWGYFDRNRRRLALFAAELVLFALAMYGLVNADSLLLLYIFWEITSVLSFLLVDYFGEQATSRRAANMALMVTTLGGLAMLVGIVLFGTSSGVWYLSEIPEIEDLAAVPNVTTAVVLILAGAITKSAIAPAHFWLPGAMAAPTPVSAYLHSAAMVKAGIYLVARLAPEFHVIDSWYLVILPLGLLTMLMGGWMSLRQTDLKLILAYGTVSQLGFMMSVISVGSRATMLAGLALVTAHSLFKATLFMVAGAIDHTTGTRNTEELSGLGRRQPLLLVIAVLAAASMAGIPPLLGFVAKESALEAILEESLLAGMPGNIMLLVLVVGSVLTMAYSCMFLYGAFATKPADHASGGGTSPAVEEMHPVGPLLWLSPAALTALTILFGLWQEPLNAALDFHLDATLPAAPGEEVHDLALWHGFTLPLLLSAIIIAGGALLFFQRHLLEHAGFRLAALGNADTAYDAVLAFFHKLSLKLTASTQRGSLTFNLTVIFLVLIALPLATLIAGDRTTARLEVANSPWQAMAAVIIVVACAAITRVHNRLSGVILAGVTGYALAVIFALQGAPDLALTQVLVETIVMVIFMLVLRKMPTNVEWRAPARFNRARAWLAVAVGFTVTVVGMFAMNARSHNPISGEMPRLAEDIGEGRNAVNVLLVDLRGWDTFGEITVLVIAATGIASLIYGTRSFRQESRRPTLTATGRRWLAAGVDTEKAQNRALMVDVATRFAFPTMIVVSVYFFFAGHNAPGGGFAGGLVAALAFALRYLAGGREELREALPIDAGRILGVGLLTSAVGVLWPMFLGEPPLTSHVLHLDIPLIGEVHVASALVFDLGVYLIVVGLVMHILTSMGGQIDRDEADRRQRARDRARGLSRANRRRREAARLAAQRSTSAEARRRAKLATNARGSGGRSGSSDAATAVKDREEDRAEGESGSSTGASSLTEHLGENLPDRDEAVDPAADAVTAQEEPDPAQEPLFNTPEDIPSSEQQPGRSPNTNDQES